MGSSSPSARSAWCRDWLVLCSLYWKQSPCCRGYKFWGQQLYILCLLNRRILSNSIAISAISSQGGTLSGDVRGTYVCHRWISNSFHRHNDRGASKCWVLWAGTRFVGCWQHSPQYFEREELEKMSEWPHKLEITTPHRTGAQLTRSQVFDLSTVWTTRKIFPKISIFLWTWSTNYWIRIGTSSSPIQKIYLSEASKHSKTQVCQENCSG